MNCLSGLLVLAVVTASGALAADCDRACLKGMITNYVDAMVAHDPSRIPLRANVRFTEDSQDLKLGDGLRKTVTKKSDFRQDYLDVKKQIAASHVMLFEENAPVLYSVVLRVADGKITGIETLVDGITPNSRFKPGSLEKPPGGMSRQVPAGKNMPRAEMIRTALFYPEGLRIGSFVTAKTPFAKDAYRVENGTFIAGEGCPRPNFPQFLRRRSWFMRT